MKMLCDVETILFDLDGTITDPYEGITRAVAHALERYGITPPDRRELTVFIGPPLYDSFMKYYGMDREQAVRAVEYYREYYSVEGVYQNTLYDGIEELLRALKAAGKRIALATSKPERFAVMILEQFGLDKYFDCIAGATMDGSRVEKADVVAYALGKCGADRATAVMVGDRKHDIDGGKANGIRTIGVLYGYGSREEFAAADGIIKRPTELMDILGLNV